MPYPDRSLFTFLRKIETFADLDDEKLKQFEKLAKVVSVRKRDFIYWQDHPSDAVYIIKEGRVKLTKLSSYGRELTLMILHESDFLGIESVLIGSPRNTNVEALQDCILLKIIRKDFLDFLNRNPKLYIKFSYILSRRLKEFENKIESLVFKDVSSRLCELLLNLAQENSKGNGNGSFKEIEVLLTQHEIANLIGSTRETVSTLLKGFREHDIVEVNHKKIKILDPDALSYRVTYQAT